jgi:hypothetical protein
MSNENFLKWNSSVICMSSALHLMLLFYLSHELLLTVSLRMIVSTSNVSRCRRSSLFTYVNWLCQRTASIVELWNNAEWRTTLFHCSFTKVSEKRFYIHTHNSLNIIVLISSKNSKQHTRNPLARYSIGNESLNLFAFSSDQSQLSVVSHDGLLRLFHHERVCNRIEYIVLFVRDKLTG